MKAVGAVVGAVDEAALAVEVAAVVRAQYPCPVGVLPAIRLQQHMVSEVVLRPLSQVGSFSPDVNRAVEPAIKSTDPSRFILLLICLNSC